MIIDIDERDVKYERAGYSPTEPIIPHSVAIDDSWWLSWPPSLAVKVARWSRYSSQYILTTHFSFQKWSKYSGEIFVSLYSDHYPYHLISKLGRWSKYCRDIFVSLLPAGTPDPKAKGYFGYYSTLGHKTQDNSNKLKVQGLFITSPSCMSSKRLSLTFVLWSFADYTTQWQDILVAYSKSCDLTCMIFARWFKSNYF